MSNTDAGQSWTIIGSIAGVVSTIVAIMVAVSQCSAPSKDSNGRTAAPAPAPPAVTVSSSPPATTTTSTVASTPSDVRSQSPVNQPVWVGTVRITSDGESFDEQVPHHGAW